MHNVLMCNVLGFMLNEIKTQYFEKLGNFQPFKKKLDTPIWAVIKCFLFDLFSAGLGM